MELPKAIWEGTFTIFGVTLRCAVLDDGNRVINEDDVVRMFEAMAEYDGPIGDMTEFTAWRDGK